MQSFEFNELCRKEFINLFTERKISNPVALTLSLKQRVESSLLRGQYEDKIDSINISKNTRHFLNRLNQRLYGKGFTKYNKRLSVISVIEGNNFIRMHVHMVIERPERIDFEKYKLLINETWLKTRYGYNDNKILPIHDYKGWINYMLKSYSKNGDIQSSIDLDNLYLK